MRVWCPMKGKGLYYEVFNWKTGKVVSSFDKEDEAIMEMMTLGSDYDYDAAKDEDE